MVIYSNSVNVLINAATSQETAISGNFIAPKGAKVELDVGTHGVFSTLTFDLQAVSLGETWQVVQTWDALANPNIYIYLQEDATYRLVCTGFVGGTDVTVTATAETQVASPVQIVDTSGAQIPVFNGLDSEILYANGAPKTPKYAPITSSSSGATTIVTAVSTKKIRVVKWDLVTASAVNVKWQSHVTPTNISGLYPFAANGGISSSYCPIGHFETIAGEALDINLSGNVAVGGTLTYIEI